MSKIIKINTILSIAFLGLFLSSCHKDLEVEYTNLPDTDIALQNPEDVFNIAKSGFYNWYKTMNSSISPRMAMWVAADQGTCSWANSGMYHLSDEPRRAFNNDVSYTYANIFERYYSDMYATLSQMNDVLKKLDEGMKLGYNGTDTKMVRSYCYLIQGMTLGYLGLVYDQAYIVTEHADAQSVPLSPYQTVIDSALVSLDKAIEIADHKNFTIPSDWINGSEYSDEEIAALANSFAARFLVSMPRNKQENSQIDWQRVLNYANKGIQRDLAPYMDDVNWVSYFRHYTVRPGWARIDSRIIHLMDPDYPSRFPADGQNPPAASSADARLESDFSFNAQNNMKPERGYVHYSNYEYTRYPYKITTQTGNVPAFILAELDLIKAEAHAELGDLTTAIDIINAGSRTQRGYLPPLSASSTKEEILDAIFYERDIELIQTGFGIAFFDMRRRDYLQEGTLLHFPIPGKELLVLGLPHYTFGGVENADGINTSNGGWDK